MKNLNNTTTELTLEENNLYKLTKVKASGTFVVYFEGAEYIHATKELANIQTKAINKVAKMLNNKYN